MPKPKSPKAPVAKKSAPAKNPYSQPAHDRPAYDRPGSPYQGRAGQARRDQNRPEEGSREEGIREERPQRGASGSRRPPFPGKPASRAARPAASGALSGPSSGGASKPAPRRQAASSAPAPQRPKLPVPYAVVSRRASENLRRGHLWVYATEIEELDAGPGEAPALMPVVDSRGLLLGTALFSPSSQIVLRLVSRELLDQAQWHKLLGERLRAAIARRRGLLTDETNACRLVFSEADQLPGMIVDKYAGIVVLQLLAKGLDSEGVRDLTAGILKEELLEPGGELTIWERPDPRIRELEGLSAPSTTPLFTTSDDAPLASTVFELNGLSFHFDANSGQKTGAFLDQRENYAAAAAWARAKGATGRALDVCTYQGGFALHLAQVCSHVTGVDASRASLEVAEKNLELNRLRLSAEVDWIEADAFTLLRDLSEAKSGSEAARDWDLIVLDPPAFAKSKRAVEGALRGYKELNLRALRMLRAGGLLITCSCSHHVGWSDLESAVTDAAVDAHRRVTLLERRGAAQDHPVVLNLPESEYLKCLVLQVD